MADGGWVVGRLGGDATCKQLASARAMSGLISGPLILIMLLGNITSACHLIYVIFFLQEVVKSPDLMEKKEKK